MTKRLAFLSALILATAMIGSAQQAEMVNTYVPEETVIPIGGSGEVRVTVTVDDPFHVQANPVADEFLIPTTVEIEPLNPLLTGKPVYPAGKPLVLEGMSDPLQVYGGTFFVSVPIEVPVGTKPQDYTLNADLRYQACDSVKCFAPRTASFKIVVRAVKK